jgi:hypothetical protein
LGILKWPFRDRNVIRSSSASRRRQCGTASGRSSEIRDTEDTNSFDAKLGLWNPTAIEGVASDCAIVAPHPSKVSKPRRGVASHSGHAMHGCSHSLEKSATKRRRKITAATTVSMDSDRSPNACSASSETGPRWAPVYEDEGNWDRDSDVILSDLTTDRSEDEQSSAWTGTLRRRSATVWQRAQGEKSLVRIIRRTGSLLQVYHPCNP